MSELGHLLIRGVNWLGDAVMTMPALQRLREAHPYTRFTLLTHEKLADLWCGHPVINDVVTFSNGESPRIVGRRLRNLGIGAALIFPNSLRAAFECWYAKIPRRIGYASKWRRLLLTDALPRHPGHTTMHKRTLREIERRIAKGALPAEFPPKAHHMHHYLCLAAVLGADPVPIVPRVTVSEGEINELKQKFSLPIKTPLLTFIPGAEYGSAKRWPAARFAAVAKTARRERQLHILFLGGLGDQVIAEEIISMLEPSAYTNLTGRTTLRELAVGLAASSCVFTNDTGPMHLAAAVDVPVVALFGSTSPELTSPGLQGEGDSKVQILRAPPPCAPCFLRECPLDARCLNNISVESAVSAIDQAL